MKNVEFYEGIEDMPHINYMKFNKEFLRADNVGFMAVDLEKRVVSASSYIQSGQGEKAVIELDNLYLALSYARHEYDPKGIALAAITKSIKGVPCKDFTTAGLEETLSKLQSMGIAKKFVDDKTNSVKKNWKKNLNYFFLSIFLLTSILILLYYLT